MESLRFPAVSGANLEGQNFDLPASFEGDLNLAIIAFQQWHQRWVDTWLPDLRTLAEETSGLRVYELPVLQRMNTLARAWIDWGMRAGIPDKATREATITLYLDKKEFRQQLGIANEMSIHLFLVRRDGTISWRTEGPWSPEQYESLRAGVARALEAGHASGNGSPSSYPPPPPPQGSRPANLKIPGDE